MKKAFLLFTAMAFLIPFKSAFSQIIEDYILQVKGDTLVIKDYYDMDNEPNSLYMVMSLDTINVPEGRVYELKTNGYYPNWRALVSSKHYRTVIVGEDPKILVNNKDGASSPPLICTFPMTVDPDSHGIDVNGDLTIKNCILSSANVAFYVGWVLAGISDSSLHLLFENCLFEHTLRTFVSVGYKNCNLTFRDCYFVNMGGIPGSRSNGGVFDCFASQDTLLVENCTHVMAQGSLYNFRDYPFNRIIFNHNTFINCVGNVFFDYGYQKYISHTNNIFVNCNMHSFSIAGNYDSSPDTLPMGIVNVYPDTSINVNRKYLVDNNLIYWDPSFEDMEAILNSNAVNGVTNWYSQRITMNSRTKDMFDNDKLYPYLVEGSWLIHMPDFTDSKDLFTTQVKNLKSFAIESADSNNSVSLPTWRLINTGMDNFVYPDFPIPVDLSYSDHDLLTAGYGGFPLGDLNWFPAQKAAWLNQRDAEYASIDWAFGRIPDPDAINNQPNPLIEFQLKQNYPNPFNPETVISYRLSVNSNVTLKIYDILGGEVATLVSKFQNAGSYSVIFDGQQTTNHGHLASGIYIYSLHAGKFYDSKKMILMK